MKKPGKRSQSHRQLEERVCAIEAGADANAQDTDGQTALHRAVRLGRIDLARTLIEIGADIDAPNKHGQTALLKATGYKDRTDVVQMLIEGRERISTPQTSTEQHP